MMMIPGSVRVMVRVRVIGTYPSSLEYTTPMMYLLLPANLPTIDWDAILAT